MISKTDISITLFHKNYFELSPDEKETVDRAYRSHELLKEHCKKNLGGNHA